MIVVASFLSCASGGAPPNDGVIVRLSSQDTGAEAILGAVVEEGEGLEQESSEPASPPTEDVLAPPSATQPETKEAPAEKDITDPDAPLTQADLARLVALAELAGEEASARWIREEGPRAPGPLGTTRAEFLDWIKTLVVSLGIGIGTAIVFWLRRWLEPLTKWLGTQPLLEDIARHEDQLTAKLREQERVANQLRKENDRLRTVTTSKRGNGPKPPPGTRDFSSIGLTMLHGPDED